MIGSFTLPCSKNANMVWFHCVPVYPTGWRFESSRFLTLRGLTAGVGVKWIIGIEGP